MTVYITLTEAKQQLRIDDANQLLDDEIQRSIDGAVDWAENFTNRSLGELLELNSPADSAAVPLRDAPLGTCPGEDWIWDRVSRGWVDTSGWRASDYRRHWAGNPQMATDDSAPLRRDAKMGILLYMQTLFDRNIQDLPLLEKRAIDLLWPYRKAMGVG